MGLYVIDINERSKRGKEFITLLKKASGAKVQTIDEYEALEDKAIMKAIRAGEKSSLLSYEEGKRYFEKIKKRLKK